MRIPILDLKPEISAHQEEFLAAVEQVIRSGQFILGPQVALFEKEVASYLGVRNAIGCNSGTDALIIALRALGIGPGDEVITSPFTFFATAEAVSLVGATPVFADIHPDSYCLSVEEVEAAVTDRTRAVIPVHLFGNAVDMNALRDLARRKSLAVIEDTAQAMGSELGGRKLGGFGDLSAFSFFPSKNLGAFGDAGLIATDDESLATKCRMLRIHGAGSNRYHNEILGYNSRLDEIQAAVLRIKLKYLDESNEGRRRVALRYRELLTGLPGITLPEPGDGVKHVFHQYTIRVPASRRDALHAALSEKGIGSMIYYPVPLHHLPVYREQNHRPLPVSEQAAKQVISLPIWPTISAEAQLEVASVVGSILG